MNNLYKKTGTLTITLASGTENYLSDGTSYIYEDETSDEPDATIFSKSNLIITGSGALNVSGNYNTGIRSKDSLVIESGTINVISVDDAIKGKDSVTIYDGIITITSGADGIKSTNSSNSSKGYIDIQGGTINVTSGNDAIQAETDLIISHGDITILSGGGSENGKDRVEDDMPQMPDGERPEMPGNPPEGFTPGNPPEGFNPDNMENMTPPTSSTIKTTTSTEITDDTTTSTSTKGLKAESSITIYNGTFNINSADDSIHCDGDITINNGTFTMETGDDGIHADNNLEINNGTIDIAKSYEGLEARYITINGGNIHLTTSDDGLNAANSDSDESIFSLTINNVYIVVDASGDGLDANGSIYINGGTTIVNGPESNNNEALDYDVDFIITNGLLVAVGSAGMADTPSSSSTQNTINLTVSSQNAGSMVHIESENGEDILTFAPSKSYQSVIISSPNLKIGETYTAYTGGSSTGTATDGLYNNGTYSGGTEIGSVTIIDKVNNLTEDRLNIGGPGGGQMPGIPGEGQPGMPPENGENRPTPPIDSETPNNPSTDETPDNGQIPVEDELPPSDDSSSGSSDITTDGDSNSGGTTTNGSSSGNTNSGSTPSGNSSDASINNSSSSNSSSGNNSSSSYSSNTVTNNPDTGDTTSTLPYVFALVVSGFAMVFGIGRKLMKKRK